MAMWTSKSASKWRESWTRYDAIIESIGKPKLVELDNWYRNELPDALHSRDPEPFITHEELKKLMDWKLTKGKWRPQLKKYVQNLTSSQVEKAFKDSFGLLKEGKLKKSIEAACVLKGIGPATASAVLAAYDGSIPFMGDEALEAIESVIGPRKYTLPHYLNFIKELQTKVQWLNEQDAKDESKQCGNEWNAQMVQLVLYATTHDTTHNSTNSPAPSSSIKNEPKDSEKLGTKRKVSISSKASTKAAANSSKKKRRA